MPPSLHAVLGASSAKRWLTCTPSARLCEKLTARFGAETSPYAAEGTKAHALAEMKVRLAYYEADGMTAAKHSRMSAEEQAAYIGINRFRYDALRSELREIPKDMEQATDSYRPRRASQRCVPWRGRVPGLPRETSDSVSSGKRSSKVAGEVFTARWKRSTADSATT